MMTALAIKPRLRDYQGRVCIELSGRDGEIQIFFFGEGHTEREVFDELLRMNDEAGTPVETWEEIRVARRLKRLAEKGRALMGANNLRAPLMAAERMGR